jgi:CheY-like chemotaxis protein
VLDGFGVLRAVRADEELRPIPVVAVTASAMMADREKVLAAGFTGYISKPIDPTTFVDEIAAFARRRDA